MQICMMPSLLPIKGKISVSAFKWTLYHFLYHSLIAFRKMANLCKTDKHVHLVCHFLPAKLLQLPDEAEDQGFRSLN